MNAKRMARALGWFSIGLGLAEVIAPRRLGRLIGAPGHHRLVRTLGMREIASGIGLVTGRATSGKQSKWIWARIGGDAIDLALLGSAVAANGASGDAELNGKSRGRTLAAIGAVAPVVIADVLCARQLITDGLA